ncbi:hypothetical protein FB451DRAFT_1265098 [Mycena latifolia]|nr:hypothetical protein FB451DRAFT_1265098 [Mycena latifolia]
MFLVFLGCRLVGSRNTRMYFILLSIGIVLLGPLISSPVDTHTLIQLLLALRYCFRYTASTLHLFISWSVYTVRILGYIMDSAPM